jgi:outer membrane protein assembly factor BamE (lipoprotein component of BamABCDE complex)
MSLLASARIALLACVACLGLGAYAVPGWGEPAATARPEERGDWRDPERWRELRLGMSPAQVVALLGEPGKVTSYYAFERWEYPDALGQRINFDERGKLSAWGPFAR